MTESLYEIILGRQTSSPQSVSRQVALMTKYVKDHVFDDVMLHTVMHQLTRIKGQTFDLDLQTNISKLLHAMFTKSFVGQDLHLSANYTKAIRALTSSVPHSDVTKAAVEEKVTRLASKWLNLGEEVVSTGSEAMRMVYKHFDKKIKSPNASEHTSVKVGEGVKDRFVYKFIRINKFLYRRHFLHIIIPRS